MNEGKCCSCSTLVDDCAIEVQRQVDLLYATRDELHAPLVGSISDNIKQCPTCAAWIEKVPEDCPQIFCILCKTAWSWDTLYVVTDPNLIHAPHFFLTESTYLPPSHLPHSVKRALIKCVKALDKEANKYASDAFLNRAMYISECISLDEFKRRAYDRYVMFKKYNCLNMILKAHNLDEISSIHSSYSIEEHKINLPYV